MIDSMKYRLNYDDNSENLSISFDKEYSKEDIIITKNGCDSIEIDHNDIYWLIENLRKILDKHNEV